MAAKPYQIDWAEPTDSVKDLSKRVNYQMAKIDEMLQILFDAVTALEARVQTLEDAP